MMARSIPTLLAAALLVACGDDAPPSAADDGGSSGTDGDTGDELNYDHFLGLSAPVEIKIDDRGIPHIYGELDTDVMYAAGYQMATDRLFQMDLMRRRAAGRQAEVLGPDFVAQDELSRMMNFARWGGENIARLREDDPVAYRLVVAWLAGVNKRIEQINAGQAPMPYGFGSDETGRAPEPWTMAEHGAIAKLLFFGSSNSLENELLATIVARTFPETWEKIELARPMFNDAIMPPDERPAAGGAPLGRPPGNTAGPPIDATPEQIVGGLDRLHRALAHVPSTGSNSWAVDGRHTSDGRPLICNDPHQPLDSPSVLYAQHLSSVQGRGDLDVIGFSFAGAAGVHIGHNERVQWTATVNFADVMDIWEVELVDDGKAIMIGGTKAAIVERSESIAVAGGETQTYVVQDVPGYGVILPNDLVPLQIAAPGHALLFNWVGFAAGTEESSFLSMAHAADVDEFDAAVDRMSNGAFNFLSADIDQISYRVRIDVPDRGDPSSRQMPYLVVDGDDPASVWTSVLPRERVPASRAESRGWIATANNDPWGFTFDGDVSNDPWYYGYFFAAGHRAHRIESELTRLAERGEITRQDMTTLQLDTHSAMSDVLLPVLDEAWAAVPNDEALAGFRDDPDLAYLVGQLQAWDRQMRRSSGAALTFHVFLHLLTEEVVGDELSILFDTVLAEAPPYIIKLPGLAVTGVYPESDAIMEEGRDVLLLTALQRTAKHLTNRYGSVDAGYTWGERHGTWFDSPFGRELELGFVSTDGGEDTVNVSSSRFFGEGRIIEDQFKSGSGAVFRLVTTFSADGTPEAWVNFPPGNSAEPASKHFDDTLPAWVEGEYSRLPFTRAEVDAATDTTIVLDPTEHDGK